AIIGPIIGAYITLFLSWRWVFYVNIPIGIAAFLFLRPFEENHKGIPEPFDFKGIILFVVSSFAILLSFGATAESGLSSGKIWLFSLGAILFYLFMRHSLTCESPLIPFQ